MYLGAVATDLDLGNYADPYTQWVAMVQSNGGTPSILPGDAIAIDPTSSSSVFHSFINNQGLPAARYTVAQAKALGITSPDATSSDGQFVYVMAPDDVVTFVADNGIIVAGVAQSKLPPPKLPDWLQNIETGAKVVVGLGILGAGLYVFSFLPRGNPRPRSRRQPGRRR